MATEIQKSPQESASSNKDQIIDDLFYLIDGDKSGTLEKREILRALMFNPDVSTMIKQIPSLKGFLKPRKFKESFVKLDTKTSGHVTLEEFRNFTNTNILCDARTSELDTRHAIVQSLKDLYKIMDDKGEQVIPKKQILKGLALNAKVMTKIHDLGNLDELLHPHQFDDAFHSMPTEVEGKISENEFIHFAMTVLVPKSSVDEADHVAGKEISLEEEGKKDAPLSMGKDTSKTQSVNTVSIIDENQESKGQHDNVLLAQKGKEGNDHTTDMVLDEKDEGITEKQNEAGAKKDHNSLQSEPGRADTDEGKDKKQVDVGEVDDESSEMGSNSKKLNYSNQMYLPALSLSPTKPKRVLLPNGTGTRWSYKGGVKTRNISIEEMREVNRKKVYSPQKLPGRNEWSQVSPSHHVRPSEPTPLAATFGRRGGPQGFVRSPTSLFLQEEQSKEGYKARRELKRAVQARHNQIHRVNRVYSNSMSTKSRRKGTKKGKGHAQHYLLKGAHRQYSKRPARPAQKPKGIPLTQGGRKGKFVRQKRDMVTTMQQGKEVAGPDQDNFDEMFDLMLKKEEAKAHPHFGPLEKEMKARSSEIQAELKEMRYKAIIQQAKLKRLFETGTNILPENNELDVRINETISAYKLEAAKAAKMQKKARRAAEKAHYQWLLTIDDNVESSIDNKLTEKVRIALEEANSTERQEVMAEKRMLERQRRNMLIEDYKRRENVLFKSNEARPSRPTLAHEYEKNLLRKKKVLETQLKPKGHGQKGAIRVRA